MSDIIIKAENISKAYQLGEFSTGTLTKDIQRRFALMRGKEDPFLKIGEANDRSSKGGSNIVWSLKDINFDINQGDAVGIIGRNGAGKSTLLKVLSRVTSPTTGSIKVKGRIASLLEVGTGFHPELTGKENIFLNGAILGMRKHEIKKHFDAIVDFSGVERYIDTPVKRYSSGMYVRLAFAVAAHLESEILIVDEVLAVGDAEFQKKCLGKIGDVRKGEGRTVLFVSHNMAAVLSLCNKGIILKNGTLHSQGDSVAMIDEYLKLGEGNKGESTDDSPLDPHKKLKIRKVGITDINDKIVAELDNGKQAFVNITVEVQEEGNDYNIGVEITHVQFGVIFSTTLKDTGDYNPIVMTKGYHTYRLELPMKYLRGGEYFVTVASAVPKVEILDVFKHETQFLITDSISPIAKTTEGRNGAIVPIIQWEKLSY